MVDLILEKPIFSYAYDYKVYLESRGLYPNYQNLFMDGPIEQENELIQKIKNLDIKEYSNFSKLNKEKFINSTEPVVEKVVEKIFCEEYRIAQKVFLLLYLPKYQLLALTR